MLQPMGLACVILCVSTLFLVSQAQLFETGAASLGNAPVGFISRVGVFGDSESFASLGNAPVGVYQRRQYPQPWYEVPRKSVVVIRQPAKPPMVRPPVNPACRLPGPCRSQVVRPVRPHYKPAVRPPVRPGVRPPKRPIRPYATTKPKPYRPRPKPGGVEERKLGGLLGLIGLG